MYVYTGHIWQYLVTENRGKITAVLEVRTAFLEKIITYEDGHSTQDKRSKQVGMNVVAGATEFPIIEQTQNNHCSREQNLYSCEKMLTYFHNSFV